MNGRDVDLDAGRAGQTFLRDLFLKVLAEIATRESKTKGGVVGLAAGVFLVIWEGGHADSFTGLLCVDRIGRTIVPQRRVRLVLVSCPADLQYRREVLSWALPALCRLIAGVCAGLAPS